MRGRNGTGARGGSGRERSEREGSEREEREGVRQATEIFEFHTNEN